MMELDRFVRIARSIDRQTAPMKNQLGRNTLEQYLYQYANNDGDRRPLINVATGIRLSVTREADRRRRKI